MTNIWNLYAKIYDAIIGNSTKNEELFQYIRKYIKKTDYIYNGACGTGIFSIELSSYADKIEACDLSENMLRKTDEKIRKNKITNINTHLQDITNIEYPENTFDVALAPNIIHLLDNPEDALNELKRVVKKEGIIIIPTYITKQENKTIQKIGSIIFSLVGFNPNSWTEKEYLDKLTKYNMKIIEYKTFKLKRYECTVIIKNNK